MKFSIRRLTKQSNLSRRNTTDGLDDACTGPGLAKSLAGVDPYESYPPACRRSALRRSKSERVGLRRWGSKKSVVGGSFRVSKGRGLCSESSSDGGDDDGAEDMQFEDFPTKNRRRHRRFSDLRSSICSIISHADTVVASNAGGGGGDRHDGDGDCAGNKSSCVCVDVKKPAGNSWHDRRKLKKERSFNKRASKAAAERDIRASVVLQPSQHHEDYAAQAVALSAAARRSGRRWMVRRQSTSGTISTAGTASTRSILTQGSSFASLNIASTGDDVSVGSATRPNLVSGLPQIGEEDITSGVGGAGSVGRGAGLQQPLPPPPPKSPPSVASGSNRSPRSAGLSGRQQSVPLRRGHGSHNLIPDGIELVDGTDDGELVGAYGEDLNVDGKSVVTDCSDLTGPSVSIPSFPTSASGSGASDAAQQPRTAVPRRRGSIERPAAQGRRRSSLCRIPDGIALLDVTDFDDDDDVSAFAEDSFSDIGSVTGGRSLTDLGVKPEEIDDLGGIAAAVAAAAAAFEGGDGDCDENHNLVRTDNMRPARAGRRRSSLFSIPDNVRVLAEGLTRENEDEDTSRDAEDAKPAAIAESETSGDAVASSSSRASPPSQIQVSDMPRRFDRNPRARRKSDPTYDAGDDSDDDDGDDGNSVATGRSSIFPPSFRAARRFSLESACSAPVAVRALIDVEVNGADGDSQSTAAPTDSESDSDEETDEGLESEAPAVPADSQPEAAIRFAPLPAAASLPPNSAMDVLLAASAMDAGSVASARSAPGASRFGYASSVASVASAPQRGPTAARSSVLDRLQNLDHRSVASAGNSGPARRGSSASSPGLTSLAASLASVARQQQQRRRHHYHGRSGSMNHVAASSLNSPPVTIAAALPRREQAPPSVMDQIGHQSLSSVLNRIQGHQSSSSITERIGTQSSSSVLDRIQGHRSTSSIMDRIQAAAQQPRAATAAAAMASTNQTPTILDRIEGQQSTLSLLDRIQSQRPSSPLAQDIQADLPRTLSFDIVAPSTAATGSLPPPPQQQLHGSSSILDRIQGQQPSSILDRIQGHQSTPSVVDRIQARGWETPAPADVSERSARAPAANRQRHESNSSVLDRIQGQHSSSSILDRIQGHQSTSSILDSIQARSREVQAENADHGSVSSMNLSALSPVALSNFSSRSNQRAVNNPPRQPVLSTAPVPARRNGSAPGSLLSQSTAAATSSLLGLTSDDSSSAAEDTANAGPPTPLYNAVSACAPYPTIRSLIDADPSSTGKQNGGGLTPLHCAIERYDTPIAVLSMLLEANPSVAALRSRRGHTPVDLLWKRFVEPESYRSEGARQAAARLKRMMENVVSDDACASGKGRADKSSGEDQKPCHKVRARKARALRALYSSVGLREFWELMTAFVRAAHTGSLDEGEETSIRSGGSGASSLTGSSLTCGSGVGSRRWRLLHGAAAIGCPPLLLRFASALNPEHVHLRDDQDGRMPLHHFSASAGPRIPGDMDTAESRRSSDKAMAAIARTLVNLYPQAAAAPDGLGRLPLSLAIESRLPWVAIRALFLSNPSALTSFDVSTGMLPFMTAAATVDRRGDDANIDVIFRLIRENPLEVMRGIR